MPMAISRRMVACRHEMLGVLAESTANALNSLKGTLEPSVALELRVAVGDLLRETWRAFQRAQTDDECIAAMRTAAIMLRLIADDMDEAAIERAKTSIPFPQSLKSKS
jgi:hypothetical protein